MPLATAVKTFSLLTIGDGLVAQIPSLLMSISAAIMVTRVNNAQDISQQTIMQLFSDPKPLLVTSVILFILAIIPHMPHLPFIALSMLTLGASYFIMTKKNAKMQKTMQDKISPDVLRKPDNVELDWDEVFHRIEWH